MSVRLPTHLVVGALLRRVNDAGGMGMVRASGDAQAGGVLLLLEDGGDMSVKERGIGADGQDTLIDSTPADGIEDYWRRRRARDPDLWVVELIVAEAERFAAESLLTV